MTASMGSDFRQEYLDFALALADSSRPILRQAFRKPVQVDEKADCSPVTVLDREIETIFRHQIRQTYPDHGILGEEFPPHHGDAEYVWVLDPLDGTAGFVTGRPLFGTLIALLEVDTPILGVIDHPIPGERWVGMAGGGCHLNGGACHTRPCLSLDTAMLYATSPHMFSGSDKMAFEALCQAVKRPQYGLDCYAYGLLASGWVDIVAESSMKPCDFLALVPVVEGAGGYISDWEGNPLCAHSDGRVLAVGDRRLHQPALDILARGGNP